MQTDGCFRALGSDETTANGAKAERPLKSTDPAPGSDSEVALTALPLSNQRRRRQVLGNKPNLRFVRPNDVANEHIVRSVIAGFVRL